MVSLLVRSLHWLRHSHKIEQDINSESCKDSMLKREKNHVSFRKVEGAVISATETSVSDDQKHHRVPSRQEPVLGWEEEVVLAFFLVPQLLLLFLLLLFSPVVIICFFPLVQQSFLFPLETIDKLDWISTYYITVRMSSVPYISIDLRLRSSSFTRFRSFIIAVFFTAPVSIWV